MNMGSPGDRAPAGNEVTTNRDSYYGPLGEVIHAGRYFFAWKEETETILIGTYQTFDEAIAALLREAENRS
jgi:hypothetical protein